MSTFTVWDPDSGEDSAIRIEADHARDAACELAEVIDDDGWERRWPITLLVRDAAGALWSVAVRWHSPYLMIASDPAPEPEAHA